MITTKSSKLHALARARGHYRTEAVCGRVNVLAVAEANHNIVTCTDCLRRLAAGTRKKVGK